MHKLILISMRKNLNCRMHVKTHVKTIPWRMVNVNKRKIAPVDFIWKKVKKKKWNEMLFKFIKMTCQLFWYMYALPWTPPFDTMALLVWTEHVPFNVTNLYTCTQIMEYWENLRFVNIWENSNICQLNKSRLHCLTERISSLSQSIFYNIPHVFHTLPTPNTNIKFAKNLNLIWY